LIHLAAGTDKNFSKRIVMYSSAPDGDQRHLHLNSLDMIL